MLNKRTLFIALTALMIMAGLYLLGTSKPPEPPKYGGLRSGTTDTIQQLHVQALEKNQEDGPDYSKIWGAVTAFLVALFSGIKVISELSNRPLELRLEAIATDSKQQFAKVFTVLDVLEDSMVRKSITDGLRVVVRGYMHYNRSICEKTRILIDCQCERLIEFSDEVMSETYNLDNWEQMQTKIESQSHKGRAQVRELFGSEFAEKYKVMQTKAVSDFRERLHVIASDDVVNSKYNRYKNAAETFLHQLITGTLALTHKMKQNEEYADRHAR